MTSTQILRKSLLEFGNINRLIEDVVASESWEDLQKSFNSKKCIIVVGHGGNLAIADHIAVDVARLTKGEKTTLCPGSAINATSFINDGSFDMWMKDWFVSNQNLLDPNNTLIIGISSSGKSRDIRHLFDYANGEGFTTSLISATHADYITSSINITTHASSYHSSEIVALALGYQLVHGYGHTCPTINS